MFRLWAKEFKDNRMLKSIHWDMVICDDSDDLYGMTHKIFNALDLLQGNRNRRV